jgi:hypothetical protein
VADIPGDPAARIVRQPGVDSDAGHERSVWCDRGNLPGEYTRAQPEISTAGAPLILIGAGARVVVVELALPTPSQNGSAVLYRIASRGSRP